MPIPVPAIAYMTCTGINPAVLDAQVTAFLQQGWSLWGQPYVMPGEEYCQAMIQLFEE